MTVPEVRSRPLGGRVANALLWRMCRAAGMQPAPAGWPVQRVSVWQPISAALRDVEGPVMLDGGARSGATSRTAREWLPGVRIHAFEPNPDSRARLERLAAEWKGAMTVSASALSDVSGPAALNVNGYDETSSLLPASAEGRAMFGERIEPIGCVEIETTMIDEWAAASGVERIDLLKLDLQGAELAALRGAARMLAGVRVALIETQFIPIYEGAPTAAELVRFLDDAGFGLVGFYNVYYRDDGRAVQGDGLWIADRPLRGLDSTPDATSEV